MAERITIEQVTQARERWLATGPAIQKAAQYRASGASIAAASPLSRTVSDPGLAGFDAAVAESELLRFAYEDLRARYVEQEHESEAQASHELALSNAKIAKGQLWVAGMIGLFTLVQAAGVALDHLRPSSPTVVCSGGK